MKRKSLFLPLILLSTLCTSCKFITPKTGDIHLSDNKIYPVWVEDNTSEALNNLKKKSLKYDMNDFMDNCIFDVDSFSTKGANILVVPVWFDESSDYISNKENVRNDIALSFFGTNADTGFRSVKTYYEELSKGHFVLDGIVSDWYDTKISMNRINQNNVHDLVTSCAKWYFNQIKSKDKTYFDYDKNGYIDGIILVYGVPNYMNLKIDNDCYWAFTSWIPTLKPDLKSPNLKSFCFQSYDFMYGTNKNRFGYGDTRYTKLDTHTYIHETGHLLGLEDLYDYENTDLNPAGGYTMQDRNVCSHDPFSVLSLGWAKPYVPTSSDVIKIKPFTKTNDVILLSLPNFIDSPFDEYFLIEYYTPDSLNELDSKYNYGRNVSGVNDSGIRLWHIDARLFNNQSLTEIKPSYTLTNNPTKSRYGVYFAMSNSSGGDYASYLGSNYYDFNLVQLIHKTKNKDGFFNKKSLFIKGDAFDISKYSTQFKNGYSMNDKTKVRWSFKVNNLTSEHAEIAVNLNY